MAFYGRVALITGGASGMGQLMALRLAKQGAKVAIADLNEKSLADTAAQAATIVSYACDVSNEAQVNELVANVQRDLGPIDRLAHAAAIMPGKSLAGMSASAINRVMSINYGGTVNLVKAVLPQMLERHAGDIIVFGSIAGVVPTPHLGAYCASKAAVNTFMEVLYHEHYDSGIRFLLACPSAVNTPLIAQALESGPKVIKDASKSGNMASPESIIDAIEAGLEKGQWRIFPGEAAFIARAYRHVPGLVWSYAKFRKLV